MSEIAWIGQGIAFAGLCVASAWLEINGKPAGGMWAFVIIWAVLTDWVPKQ